MGPSIILDKSAYQCLSKDDTRELSTYFYVVVPPVLILEILADLKKPTSDQKSARRAVQQLSDKVQPVDGIVNLDYRTLLISNLLGGHLALDRRPVVGGARRARAADGSRIAFIDSQPENEALIRWSCGRFDEAEVLLAEAWRAASRAIDLESFQRRFHGKFGGKGGQTLSVVRQAVDQLLNEPGAQAFVMEALIADLQTIPEVRRWTLSRWHATGGQTLKDFAGYAHHCARVSLIFQQALVQRLIGTRSTNRIDMEYFYYSPFTNIFCSGDKFHIALAEEILGTDQTFVHRDELRAALREVGIARSKNRELEPDRRVVIQPAEGSLIRTLWTKHWGTWPDRPPGVHLPRSEAEQARTRESIKLFTDAVEALPPRPQPRWPCP